MNAKERCRHYRKRILEISQTVPALHIGGAFSSVEIIDAIYNELMKPGDTFVLSKGHAAILQYVVLEEHGLDVSGYSTGKLCVHPVLGTPGIAATTGALGHGLAMAVGMAMADPDHTVYVLMSDGELQEGSTWEAALLASSRDVTNLVVFIDNNDFQSASRTSHTHPTLYPIVEKWAAFRWAAIEIDGHINLKAIDTEGRIAIVCRTVKGRGVSFMEHVPMWHYRSPSPEEYQQALSEL